MGVRQIIADASHIIISISKEIERTNVKVVVKIPYMNTTFLTYGVGELDIEYSSHEIRIPRYYMGIDLLEFTYELWNEEGKLEGIQYVSKLLDCSQWNYTYPQPDSIKALGASGDDIGILGIKQSLININLPAIMTLSPMENDIVYESNGEFYYFKEKEVNKIDSYLLENYSYGVFVTAILLNAPKLFDSGCEEELLKKVIHPCFDYKEKSAYISAFNMRTREGQEYFKAFIGFLASRYSREDGKYGRMCGFILSNEINSQYVWGNAGEMSVEDYTHEYTIALRMAWLVACKSYKNFRVYVSLDHFWTSSLRPDLEKRFYQGRDIIDLLTKYSREEGNFPWNVAHHPYPENLFCPDFYNDRTASFDFSTMRITFKNIEVLAAYLSQEEYRYEGESRRIILSEQGFNSKGDAFSEKQGAAAFCLAYQKAKKIETIDLFTHHAYVDNRFEFGLNLGVRRLNDDDSIGEAKPIYYVMRDMDTAAEVERIKESRAFIGEELYDMILNPTVLYGDADTSKASQFQEEA